MNHWQLFCYLWKSCPTDHKTPAGNFWMQSSFSYLIYGINQFAWNIKYSRYNSCFTLPHISSNRDFSHYCFFVSNEIITTFGFSYRDQDIVILNQSLRILSNLIAAGAVNSRGILDEIIGVLLSFTSALVRSKVSDGNDLVMKVYNYYSLLAWKWVDILYDLIHVWMVPFQFKSGYLE